LKEQIMESSKQVGEVEQNVRQVLSGATGLTQQTQDDITQRVKSIREEANENNLSDEVVKQRVEKEIVNSLSNQEASGIKGREISEEIKQRVVRDVQETSIGNTTGRQRLIQEVEEAKTTTPSQLQR